VVLADLGPETEARGFVDLTGPSRSGRSTLLNLNAGIHHADAGQPEVAGAGLGQPDEAELGRGCLRSARCSVEDAFHAGAESGSAPVPSVALRAWAWQP